MNTRLKTYFETRARKVDQALDRYLRHGPPEEPDVLREAMRYSLFAGGKRLRPILVIAAAECCGSNAKQVLPTACAVEMIHTYSLIHDDLPAMDNDDLRRGKPTNHKVFGEATAILAGDGLLTYAFELIANNGNAEVVRVIASGAGTCGMVGGQVEDLKAQGLHLNGNIGKAQELLQRIHRHKTAALITSCLEAGAILAGASSPKRLALKSYGQCIGLAFQIADDILDIVGDKKKLGKKGSDAKNKKLTYPSLYGMETSKQMARELTQKAHAALKPLADRAKPLHDLADYIIERDH
ncbi:MAG: polyprenyl synthetase family protein [Elusimicrobia bacterium]|nr:polyprenyl synthetase family protein [Elusimicrobiota bacterium]